MLFFGQHPNERLMFWTRKHWISLVPMLFFLLFVGGVFAALFISFLFKGYLFLLAPAFQPYIVLCMTALALVWFHLLFVKLFAYFFNFIIVTDSRIIEVTKTAFVYDERETIDLPKVQDIKTEKNGFWPVVFHYGDLELMLSNTENPKMLHYIPHPSHAQERITQIKRTHIFKEERTIGGVRLIPLPGEEQITGGMTPPNSSGG